MRVHRCWWALAFAAVSGCGVDESSEDGGASAIDASSTPDAGEVATDAGRAADAGADAGACSTVCDGACVDLAIDPRHCGDCDTDCTTASHRVGVSCVEGTCAYDACEIGWNNCDGDLTELCDTPTDVAENCGAGCVQCPTERPFCDPPASEGADFACASRCPNEGDVICGDPPSSGCGDVLSNVLSCGSCTRVCPVDPHGMRTCVGGECHPVCDSGYHECDGICVSSTSTASCGSRCTPCPAERGYRASCAVGRCVQVCLLFGGCGTCVTNDECQDSTFCDGYEICRPSDPGAGARGCVAGAPLCSTGGGMCDEAAETCVAGCDAPDAPTGPVACGEDAACSDQIFCNGVERCLPGAGADERGCIPAGGGACPLDQVCDEVEDMCVLPGCDIPDMDRDSQARQACGGADCNDNDPTSYPGNTEVCDTAGHDEDCDPCTVSAADVPGTMRDGDGDLDGFASASCTNPGPAPTFPVCDPYLVEVDGGLIRGSDCDDARASTHPGQIEVCNGRDDDCSGIVDDDSGIATFYYRDRDLDGDGDPACGRWLCAAMAGYVATSSDCDETNAAIGDGSQRCSRDVNGVALCTSGTWSGATSCASDTHCVPQTDGTGRCEPLP